MTIRWHVDDLMISHLSQEKIMKVVQGACLLTWAPAGEVVCHHGSIEILTPPPPPPSHLITMD